MSHLGPKVSSIVFTVRGRAHAGGVASGLVSSFPAFLRTLCLLTLPGAMITFVHKLLDMMMMLLVHNIQAIFGVKGYSPLHLLPSFDTVKCVPVEYMHCVLIGVVKNMPKLWFNSSYHKEEW